MNNRLYTIQEVANILGVSTKTLRRWDQRGRFVPIRTAGNQRRYTQEQINQLKTQNSKVKTKEEIRANIPQGEAFFKPETPKESKAAWGLPSILSNLPSGSFLKNHFLLRHKDETESKEEPKESFVPARRPPARLSPLKVGFAFAALVLVLSFAGSVVMIRYNLMAGLNQKKEQFAKFIDGLPQISISLKPKDLLVRRSLGEDGSFASQDSQAVLAAADGVSDLILNINVPTFFSQKVGIGTTAADPSAILDLTSEDRGFLAPRMTEAQIKAIDSPAGGLFVYNTDTNHYNMYDGTSWLGIFSSIGDSTTGEAFTEKGTSGTALWFYDADGRGKLTTANLSAARVYTLPDAGGEISLLGQSISNSELVNNKVTISPGTNMTGGGEVALGSSVTLTLKDSVDLSGTLDVSGATTLDGDLAAAGATLLNGNVTLGDAAADTLTFTGRVAQDSDLIPIGTTGTNDLGSLALPWDNLYADNVFAASSGTSGYWQRNSQALSPTNITDDLLLGATGTSSAKFGFINVAGGDPTATISGNLSLAVPTTAGANTFNLLNNSTLNFQRSPGGDAGLTTALFIQNNGNVGIGTTSPNSLFHVKQSSDAAGGGIRLERKPEATYVDFYIPTGVGGLNDPLVIQHKWLGSGSTVDLVYMGRNGEVIFPKAGSGTSARVSILSNSNQRGLIVQGASGQTSDLLAVVDGNATIYNTASLGSEKVTNGAFADDTIWSWGTNWAHDAVDLEADHTAGDTSVLEQSVGAVTGEIYQVVFTVRNRTAGSVTPQIGGADGTAVSSNATSTQQIRATGTGNLKFTPTSAFDGSIDDVSVKLITGGNIKLAGLLTGGGTSGIKVTAAGNVGIGNTTPLTALDVTGSASLSANMSLRGAETAHTFNILDNGTLNFQRSPGGDAGLTTALFIQNNGNVGIGTANPSSLLNVNGTLTATTINAFTLGGTIAGGGNQINNIVIGASTPLAGTFTTLTANGDVTLGDEITDNITFTGRVALDSDLIPIGTTGTNDLGSLALPWDNLYADNIYSPATGTSGYWQRASAALSPTNITDDLLVGGTATSSAKFGILNMAGGNPTATMSSNLSLIVPTGNAPAATLNLLNNGTLNFQRSPGGDAGLATALFIQNNGNVGIGTTVPLSKFDINGGAAIGSYAGSDAAPSNGLIVSGNVGIKTSTPTTFDLEVGGNIGPSSGSQYDLGSSSRRWNNVYGVTANFTTFSAGEATISGTTTQDFLINSDNVTDDAEDASLSFGRGTGNTNSQFKWNSTTKQLSTNTPSFAILPDTTIAYSGTSAFMVNQVQNQDIMTASASGITKFVINNSGNVGIGNTTPLTALDVTGSASLSANLSLRGAETAHIFNILDNGTLNVQRSPGGDAGLATALFIQNNGSVGIGNTAPGAMLSVGSSTQALISSAGLLTIANTTDSTSGSTGSIYTAGGLGVTKDLAVDGGDMVTAAETFNLINTTATTVNFAGAATTLSIGAATGTVTLNNATTAITGALTANGDVTLGDNIADNITFTGRVALDSDLIPIGTTGTNDLGSLALPWDNLYADNIYSPASGVSGYWQRASAALSPTNITDDLLIGGTSTASAKFAFINVAGGNPTATISGNLSLAVPTTAGANTFNLLNNSTLNFQRSPGGDAGLATALFIQNNGNVGVGTTSPGSKLSVDGDFEFVGAQTLKTTTGNLTISAASGADVLIGDGSTILYVDGGTDTIGMFAAANSAYALYNSKGFGEIGATSYFGEYLKPHAYATVANTAAALTAIEAHPLLNSANTKNWTATVGLRALTAGIEIGGGAAGTVTGAAGLYVNNVNPEAMTLTNQYGIYIANLTGGGSDYGIYVVGADTAAAYFGDNVGIGNLTPLTALDITGSASLSANLSLGGAETAHTFNILDNGTLNIQRSPGGDAGLTTALFIQNNGNVGIGTTAPGNILTLGGAPTISTDTSDGSDTKLLSLVGGGAAGLTRGGNVYVAGNEYSSNKGSIWLTAGQPTSPSNWYEGSIWFNTDNADRMVIGRSGNVGIGTTSPLATLDVRGNLGTTPAASVSATSSFASLIVDNSGIGDLFTASKSGAPKFVINNAGNVGIGTANPSSLLNVNGTLTATTINAFTLGGTIAGGGNQINNIVIGAFTPLAGTFTTLTANGDVTLGNEITDNITFTGRVALDSDLIPIGTTGTNDLGSSALPWDNLYADNIYSPATGTSGYWQRASAALSPTNITDDLLLGATSTASAKFGFINVAGGDPTATISGNLSLAVPTTAGANTFNLLNNSTLNFQRSPGGDAGLTTALFIQNNGNVGIGTTTPIRSLHVIGPQGGGLAIGDTLVGTDRAQIIGYSTDYNPIDMRAQEGTQLWLATDGNVGIGNTTPLTALDVTGSASLSANLSLRGAGTAHTFNILQNGTLNIQRSPGGDAGLATALFIQNNGNVGIGTTSPGDKLEVNGKGTFNDDLSVAGNIYLTGASRTLNANAGDLTLSASAGNDVLIGDDATILYVDGGTGTIGVGTAASSNYLLILDKQLNNLASANSIGVFSQIRNYNITADNANYQSGVSASSIYRGSANLTNTAALRGLTAFTNIDTANAGTITGAAPIYIMAPVMTGSGYTVTNEYGIYLESMAHARVSNSYGIYQTGTGDINYFAGNVGIGTTSPLATLDVRGNLGTTPAASVSATSSFASLIVDNSGIGDLFTASKSGATKFVITNSGNVGIGTANPSSLLNVNGTLTATTINAFTLGGTIAGGGNQLNNIIIGTSTPLAGTFTTLTANGDVTLGDEITDNITFTGRVALDSDLIPIGTTGTNDLGSLALPWDNLYADNIYSPASGVSGYWQRASAALSPTNITDDLLIGGTSTASAKFAFINVAGGNPTATISGNLSLAVPTTAGANTFNLLNNSTLNFQRSPGGDAGLTTALFIQNNGNVGIGTTAPGSKLSVDGDFEFVGAQTLKTTTGNLTISVPNNTDNIIFKKGSYTTLEIDGIANDYPGSVGIGGAPTRGRALDIQTNFGAEEYGGASAYYGVYSRIPIYRYTVGSITDTITGVYASASMGNSNVGDWTNAVGMRGFQASNNIGDGGGSVTGAAGVYISNAAGGATLTNQYGLYIEDLTKGSNDYGIYVVGADTAAAYFGDKVGIGNLTPLTALDITGSASLSANLSLGGAETAHTFNILDNGTLNIQRSPGGDGGLTTALFIQNNGNVGIGNTTPLTALDITGSASLSANLSLRGAGTAHTFDLLDNGTFNFRRSPGGDAGLATALFIQNNGNVGIGTTAPATLLSLANDGWFSGVSTASGQTTNMFKVNTADQIQVGAALNVDGGITFPTDASYVTAMDLPLGSSQAANTANGYVFRLGTSNIMTVYGENNGSGVLQNGRVGIGTTAPLFKLDVRDAQTATAAAQIYNTGATGTGLAIKLGFTDGGAATNVFTSFLNGNGLVQGLIKSNASSGVTYQTNGVADFAEYFEKDQGELIPFGSVVCLKDNGLAAKCDPTAGSGQGNIVGVASEHPAFLGGEYLGERSVPVGLVGQVRTRVSAANGAIKIGDPLTTSATPGVAVKATTTGQILGKAIEGFDGQGEGSILVSVNITWYNPSIYVSYDGTLAGMATTVASIGDQLTLQGDALQAQLALQGETLQAQIASNSASLAEQVNSALQNDPLFDSLNNKVNDLQSRIDLLSQEAEQQASISAFLTEIVNAQVLGASTSAILDLGDVELNNATIAEDLMVLGRATVTDLGVTGNINAGLLTIHGIDGEIGTLGGDLFLQKSGLGGLDILDGKIVIDTLGNMTVIGTITADEIKADNYTVLGDQSIGSATIPAGLSSIEISTPVASGSSKIFLTLTTLTDKQLTVASKSEGKFKVAIPAPAAAPISFDWWIVGNKN